MKHLPRAPWAALLACAACAACTGVAAHAADLQFAITGGPAAPAKLYAALYDSAEAYQAGRPVAQQSVPMQDGSAQLLFQGLAPGRYALRAFADENGNGRLDSNLLGLPIERYGFSNDAKGNLGAPGFEAAAMPVDGDTRAAVHLR